jgi:hypothetical protein
MLDRLCPPLIIIVDVVCTNDREIDVAVGVGFSVRERSESNDVHRLR